MDYTSRGDLWRDSWWRFCSASQTNMTVRVIITQSAHSPTTQRTPALTSNSWGISRRARYSLASLVFISSRISFWNLNLSGAFFFSKKKNVASDASMPHGDNLWWTSELHTVFSSAHFCLVCVWTLQLDSCRRCHLATLLCDADALLVRLPSYSAELAARTVCALTLEQRLRAVPKSACSVSQPGRWVGNVFLT